MQHKQRRFYVGGEVRNVYETSENASVLGERSQDDAGRPE